MRKEQDVPQKLLTATQEVKAILEKYNLAGLAVLHCPDHEQGPGFCQHVEVLGPSYSCIEFNGHRLVVRELPAPDLMAEDPELPRRRRIRDTINMLFNIRAKASQLVSLFVQAEIELRQRFSIPPPGKNGTALRGPGGPGA